MPPKAKIAASKGGLGAAKKGARPAGPTRNITRWSANKDIVLLCALAKECRRDKFQPSFDRVAAWIGPNVTGAAVEQHIGKLYSKLTQHRAVTGPKTKKRKSEAGEESQEDYVLNEDAWGKGNEALANIFYDKPGINSARLVEEEEESSGDELEVVAGFEQLSRKRAVAGKVKPENDSQDEAWRYGGPNGYHFAGTKYVGVYQDQTEDDSDGRFCQTSEDLQGIGFGMDNAGNESALIAYSGNQGASENVNSLGELVDLPSYQAMTPARRPHGEQSMFHLADPNHRTRPDEVALERYLRRQVGLDVTPSSDRTIPNSVALQSDQVESSPLDPRSRVQRGNTGGLPPLGVFSNGRRPAMPSNMPMQWGNVQSPTWPPHADTSSVADYSSLYEPSSNGTPNSYNMPLFEQQAADIHQQYANARLLSPEPRPMLGVYKRSQGTQDMALSKVPGGEVARRVLFPDAKKTARWGGNTALRLTTTTRMAPPSSGFIQSVPSPTRSHSDGNSSAALRRGSMEGLSGQRRAEGRPSPIGVGVSSSPMVQFSSPVAGLEMLLATPTANNESVAEDDAEESPSAAQNTSIYDQWGFVEDMEN